jgi:hypothetical protein
MNEQVIDRVTAELNQIAPEGSTKLVANPDAVIYYNLPSILESTDVLVRVPDGYPGATLDYACLPEGSPLINHIKGAAQDMIEADGRRWQQISYHPHNGGGGPAWDPTIHGFHTYIDEILTWLATKK